MNKCLWFAGNVFCEVPLDELAIDMIGAAGAARHLNGNGLAGKIICRQGGRRCESDERRR
jgi:hypothetical protein